MPDTNIIPSITPAAGQTPDSTPEEHRSHDSIISNGPSAPDAELPARRQIFDELKSGRHWAFGDDVYPELSGVKFNAYANWFSHIGIQLHRDPRGFCHATFDKDDDFLSPNSPNTKTPSNLILFTAIWIEALANHGQNIHEKIFQEPHRIENLPHLASEAHRRLMTDAGLASPDELSRFLSTLHRLGFTLPLPDNTFRVRPPFHRLLDICQEYGRIPVTSHSTDSTTTSDAITPDGHANLPQQ